MRTPTLTLCLLAAATSAFAQPAHSRVDVQARGVVAELVPDASAEGLSSSLALPAPDGRAGVVEDLAVRVDVRHLRRGDLLLKLTAPSGRQALLFAGQPSDTRDHVIGVFGRGLDPLMALDMFRGEALDGDWTLTVVDRVPGGRGALISWTLVARAQLSDAPAPRALRANLTRAGVAPMAAPAEDPAELVELGRLLYFDKELAGTRDISCATCHHPAEASTMGLALGYGHSAKGETIHRTGTVLESDPRNTTPIFNNGDAGYLSMFWDGRLSYDAQTGVITGTEPAISGPNPTRPDIARVLDGALAAQALLPLANPPEMRGFPGMNEIADAGDTGAAWDAIMVRLVGEPQADGSLEGGIAAYRSLFADAFPGMNVADLNLGHAANAIAAFERQAFASFDTPFDRFLRGDDQALSADALRGAELFAGKARCTECHGGSHLSDFGFYALAVPQFGIGARAMGDDPGRMDFTQDPADRYRFKTPPLRNVALTGPYMHTGAYDRLEDAVRHHLDPAGMLAAFDVDSLPREEWKVNFADYRDRDPERLAAMPDVLKNPPQLSDDEVEALVTFLNEGLTDPAALDLERWIPDTVPSGLPVRD